jgi:hypothetical protein
MPQICVEFENDSNQWRVNGKSRVSYAHVGGIGNNITLCAILDICVEGITSKLRDVVVVSEEVDLQDLSMAVANGISA